MNSTVKNVIKKSPVYTIYRDLKTYKNYSNKYGIGLKAAVQEVKPIKYDLPAILKKARIVNEGVGNFFYSIDHSIVVKTDNIIVDNMPVDYAYVINRKLEDSDTENVIKAFIKKIDDSRVTLQKPTDLKEALQAILLWNSLLWQTGHTLVGLGRLDKVLAPYDVPENAETLIEEFLQTLHQEYTFKSASLKGDTGQIIILGGLDDSNNYFCNEYTRLFIKCLQKVHLPDPKILLRCSKSMPTDLLEMAMECNATGIGSPLFSNDDIVISKLIDFGYDTEDAYNYGVSACWEPLSIGNSLEQNNLANIEYGRCVNKMILDDRFVHCADMKAIIELYIEKLEENCQSIIHGLNSIHWQKDPLLSIMMGLGKDISEGGAKYNNYGILSIGMSAAVNSILNINNFVFDKQEYTLDDIQNIIKDNYKDGVDPFSINKNGYGTDDEEAVKLTNYLIRETEDNFRNYRNPLGGKVKFGLSSPGYLDLGKNCGATLDGRKSNEPFQTHISRDKGEALTEIMNFESKLSFTGLSANANVLDVMVPASLIKDNISKFVLYMKGGIKEGIFQLQMNVLSYAQLVDAKEYPVKYPNLIVRVWGFSAYFNDLPEEYKDNLIRRAKEMEMIS
ncbi:pyruvate formate lyase family protein [Blautia marasmi]|uniref:pyruvate formate lyase family protein n=1 Tax=Blautia marasmi TaxID=1917868 RepID=UPI000CF2D711|nr:pyruvate formate lyase family protein [Blautia marasmi]